MGFIDAAPINTRADSKSLSQTIDHYLSAQVRWAHL